MTSAGGFGGGTDPSPQTRVLTSITESPNPDATDYATADKTAQIIQRHDVQIKALAQGQQQLQKGVNQASENPIQQIQQFIADIVVLLGGGELTEGLLDFGDLQYILPVLGALFGLGDGPFPLDLFAAAERFFLGYVVPTRQWTDEVNKVIDAWAAVLGIDPKFMHDVNNLITAIGELSDEITNFVPQTLEFFLSLALPGVTGWKDLGILGAILGPIVRLFSGIDLTAFGNAIDFITTAIDPWVVQLTSVINFIDEVLHIMGAVEEGISVVNDPLPQLIVPWTNLIRFIGNVRLAEETFNPVAAVQSWLGGLLLPISGFSLVQPNLQIDAGFDNSADIGDPLDGTNWTRENLDPPVTDGDWVWDLVGRTVDGSAKVVANGVDHGLLGTVIYVDEGHTFDFDAYLSWSGLTAATGALALHIQDDTGTNTAIQSISSPGSSASWTHLSGSYTIPSGVESIRLRLYVGTGASAGSVWFDDCNIRRTNLVQQGLIQDLEANLATLFGNFTTLLTAVGAGDVVTLGSDIATGISNAATALTRIGSLISGVGGTTITDVVNLLLKIQQLIDGIANALGVAGTGHTPADLTTPLTTVESIVAGWVSALALAGASSPTQLIQLLQGLIPAALRQLDGSLLPTDVSAFIANADGSISYIASEADPARLMQQADGGIVSAAQVAHQVVTAAGAAGAGVGQAVASGQQVVDHGIAALQGTAVQAGQSAQAYGAQLSGALTAWANNWMGSSLPTAAAADVANAAAQAATQAAAHAAQTAAINAQLPHFYGGSGTAGLDASANFTGVTSLPAGFSAITGSPIAGAVARYDTPAQTDSQTVSGIWSSTDQFARYLILRANATFTTVTYAKLQSKDPVTGAAKCEISTVLAGVKTVLDTFQLPGGNLLANAGYAFEVTDYAFSVTGPGGLNVSFTDSLHISQKGPLYVYGGFGTDGAPGTQQAFTSPGTYTIPAGYVAGDKFSVVGLGGGGGGSGGFGGTAGSWNAQDLIYGTDFSASATQIAAAPGVGGAAGSNGGASTMSVSGSSVFSASGGVAGASGSSSGTAPSATYVFDNTMYAGVLNGDGGNSTGAGHGGEVWITPISMALPGSLLSWAFYDSGPTVGPASAYVATAEGSSGGTYASLPTTTDQVTVNIGPSLSALVSMDCRMSGSATTLQGFMGIAFSGANTVAATDDFCVQYETSASSAQGAGISRLVKFTNQGATTGQLQYRTSTGGTMIFANRSLSVIPL